MDLFKDGITLGEALKIIEEFDEDTTKPISTEDYRKKEAIKNLLGKEVSFVSTTLVATIV